MKIAKKLDDEDYTLPEPPVIMPAKTYKTKFVDVLIKKLKEVIVALASRCFRAKRYAEDAAEEVKKITKERDDLKAENWNIKKENRNMKRQLQDFEKIKDVLGIDKIKEILKSKKISRKKKDVER